MAELFIPDPEPPFPGAVHVTNIRGREGKQGEPGRRGLPGPRGIQGVRGLRGETGEKGETGTLTGLDGEMIPAGESFHAEMRPDGSAYFYIPATLPAPEAVGNDEAFAAALSATHTLTHAALLQSAVTAGVTEHGTTLYQNGEVL